ncbi:MotE family protein [Humisphaera borealis]|uniref:Magnesium transporter MgtE intracellular domain-containing protein n=1 Tax=Humisphaera borealis TaxID=2807512 RepID=A0A7M2WWY2_9BACT|nr:hypothetical protein [Humisphaera borealis]QOV89909.1 hypothetical protein IPV69_00615 [Humisphaera borealis]
MKKLLNALVLVLAVNFLAVAGGVGWLFSSGKLDKDRIAAIKELLFPVEKPPEVVATQPATQPAAQESSVLKLDELLARYAGRRTGEQVELIQQSIDAQAVALDRRSRELDDLMKQILREKEDLARKTGALDADRQKLTDLEKKQLADAGDKGFQDSLKLLLAMPGKQAKSALMDLPDDTVVRYLQSMPPRTASKIIKEFKTPAEQTRINLVLDRMRQGGALPATQPTDGTADTTGARPPAANRPGNAAGRDAAAAAPVRE